MSQRPPWRTSEYVQSFDDTEAASPDVTLGRGFAGGSDEWP